MTRHDTAVQFVAELPDHAASSKKRGRPSTRGLIAEALKENGAVWARVDVKKTMSAASSMAVQIRKARGPFEVESGRFEALCTQTAEGVEVYARFLPEGWKPTA